MLQNKVKKSIAALLSTALLLAAAGTAYAQGNGSNQASPLTASDTAASAAVYTKTENVYARLHADGTPNGTYIVNHFRVKKAGEITDYGSFSDVINLSDTDPLSEKDGSVRFAAQTGNFYYQGNMTAGELPWKFQITYTLDDRVISSEELGGKSGALKISFRSRKNPKVNAVFSKNYVMQVSLSLDSNTCSNIKAPGAAIADAGDSTQLSFTVLPDKNADFTIEADVQNFSMSGFSIAAVPYGVDLDTDDFHTDEITGQFSALTDAAAKLNDGAEELLEGVRELDNGSETLTEGSADIQDGLRKLSENSGELIEASAKIYDALDTITAGLLQTDFSGFAELKKVPDGLEQLAAALDQVVYGLTRLKDGFDVGCRAMEDTVQGANASLTDPTEEELSALQTACGEDANALSAFQKLTEAYKQCKTLLAVWKQTAPAFEAVSTMLDASSAQSVIVGVKTVSDTLHMMANSMADSLGDTDIEKMFGELTDGLKELTDGYQDFHGGLSSYLDGVNTLAGSYDAFHGGLTEYQNGTTSLADGAGAYADGMGEFADGVRDMPTQVQETIDEMMEQYSSKDFDAVSFTDARNENISSVQFVISADGVELPKEETRPAAEEKLSFWDRLLALFGLR